MGKRTIGRMARMARSKRRKGRKKRGSQGGGMEDADLRARIKEYCAAEPEATLDVWVSDIQAAFRILKEEIQYHVKAGQREQGWLEDGLHPYAVTKARGFV